MVSERKLALAQQLEDLVRLDCLKQQRGESWIITNKRQKEIARLKIRIASDLPEHR